MFGDAIFDLIDTEDTEKIEFGEFVQAVSTFCMFEPPEVLKFVFYIFDKDKNGYIGQDELGNFIEQLHQEKIQGNLEKALEYFQRALRIDESVLGSEHPHVAQQPKELSLKK